MNILTFDIEEWYVEKHFWGERKERYEMYDEYLRKILDHLEERNLKGTFFCVGQLAVEFPQVVKLISSRGHEIGCHSNTHTWLNKMSEEGLRQDTLEAIKALEDVSGQKVKSYRAPAFSITHQNKWALNVLADCGIENDASIFPTNRDFGGFKGFPQRNPCIITNEGCYIKEFPISLTSCLGKFVAYSGGGYFRLLPYWFVNRTIRKNGYNICYFHLTDLLQIKPKMLSKEEYELYFKEPGTIINRLVRYAKSNLGRGDTFTKLNKLLFSNEFVNLEEANRIIDWDSVKSVKL